MLKSLKSFLERDILLESQDKILLAVSGGVDSVVLVHLFEQAGMEYGIAHCNFQLRAGESDEDEQFVQQLALQFQKPFYSVRFSTESLAIERKQSIQLLARELRYEWLEQIRAKEQYQYIATAHHLNDSLETMIYNLSKGTGIRGLRGIPMQNGHLIRPLLFTDKKSVLAFAEKNQIAFRTDASNATDKYTRNRIRHHIIPELEKINPSLSSSTQKTIQHLRETEQVFNWAIQQIAQKVGKKKNGNYSIDLTQLLTFPAPRTILFELLSPFGFNSDQIEQMLHHATENSGQQYHSPTYRIYRNRNELLVQANTPATEEIYLIEMNQKEIATNKGLFVFTHLPNAPLPLPKSPQTAYLDFQKLKFPLQLRHWKEGDYFHPIGMNGQRQKLKDFFINKKLSIPDKQATWILESAGKIAWIVGHRLDERFKIEDGTGEVLRVEWEERETVNGER